MRQTILVLSFVLCVVYAAHVRAMERAQRALEDASARADAELLQFIEEASDEELARFRPGANAVAGLRE